MTSYHEYNKVEKADYLVGQMRLGDLRFFLFIRRQKPLEAESSGRKSRESKRRDTGRRTGQRSDGNTRLLAFLYERQEVLYFA